MTPKSPTVLPNTVAPTSVRRCLNADCERLARRRGRTCGRCATRAWRERHREEVAAREAARIYAPAQLRLRHARASLSTALRRGRIKRTPCADCGHPKVISFFPDLAKPLEVLWLCKLHRAAALEALAAADLAVSRAEQQTRWRDDQERFASDFADLAPQLQAELLAKAQAALPPRLQGLALTPEAPVIRQALVRAYTQWRDACLQP